MGKCRLLMLAAMCAAIWSLDASAGCDPTKLEFKLLSTRRFMLDNEVMLSEFVPGESARPSLQNPLMPYCANPLPKLAYGNGAVTLSAPAGTAAAPSESDCTSAEKWTPGRNAPTKSTPSAAASAGAESVTAPFP